MQSFRERPLPQLPSVSISLPMRPETALSLCTVPMLGLLLSQKVITQGLCQLGAASEELFRGDRLPALPLLPTQTDTDK